MSSQISLNKENFSQETNIPTKSLDKPREFGRDVTNNAFAEVNKDSLLSKDSNHSSEADTCFKSSVDETEDKQVPIKSA
jgi:hypothetical protein